MTAVIRACINHLTNERVMDDTAAMLAFVDAQDAAGPGPVGCVGYCMGGGFVACAAAAFPHRIAAAASLYGTRLVTDKADSPHLRLSAVKGEFYFGFAEHDHTAPPEQIAQLEQALKDAAVKYEIEIFPGTEHGFCFPERAAYAPAAAEKTWERLFALWARNLPAPD
jgi:carboxymethylenebutenolidase